jgi:hypothetical protein
MNFFLKITYLGDCLHIICYLHYVNGKQREPPAASPLRRSVTWLPLAKIETPFRRFFFSFDPDPGQQSLPITSASTNLW